MEDIQQDQQQDQNQQSSEVSLDQLQQDLDSAMNNWKRTAADFENYKRRKEAENKELVEFAKEVTVAKLLPIIDSLEQALRHMPEYSPTTPPRQVGAPLLEKEGTNAEPLPLKEGESLAKQGEGVGDFGTQYQNWQSGIRSLLIQLDKILADLGVKKIEAKGKKFDPHFHEAVRVVESETDDDMVVEELQSGFELNGKVIRPSQVVISKKKS